MADPGLYRLLAWLDASFDASIARQEEEAAADLAFSLQQDRSAFIAFRRAGPLEMLLPDGVSARVSEIGRDYLSAGSPTETYVPFTCAVASTVPRGRAPEVRDRTLSEVLHGLARAGVATEVATPGGRLVGRLLTAAADHLELDGAGRRFVVARGAVSAIRAWRGGSGDFG